MEDMNNNGDKPVNISTDIPQVPQERATKKSSSKKAILVVSMVLLLLLAFGGGYATSFLFKNKETKTNNSTNVTTAAKVEEPTTTNLLVKDKINKPIKEYKNQEYGFSMMYPEKWGDIVVKNVTGFTGKSLIADFSKNSFIHFGAQTKDYQAFGKDGGCYIDLGVGPKQISTIDVKDSDKVYSGVSKGSDTRIVIKKEFADKNTAINKVFESGIANASGACPGFYSKAVRVFDTSAKIYGVGFFYGTRLNSSNGIQTEAANHYLKDPTYYYNKDTFNAYVNVVKSTTAL